MIVPLDVDIRKLREKKANQILICLCASLLGLYINFLVMVTLDRERGTSEIPMVPCYILAGLIHFFLIASVLWMGVEGYNMYILFVRVLNSYQPYFLRRACIIAWGKRKKGYLLGGSDHLLGSDRKPDVNFS